jgi:hypothetical protein
MEMHYVLFELRYVAIILNTELSALIHPKKLNETKDTNNVPLNFGVAKFENI